MPIAQSKIQAESIEHLIVTVRGRRAILNADLAQIYGVSTKRLNEPIKRNFACFPDDFIFRLTRAEAEVVLRSRSQFATLKRGSNIWTDKVGPLLDAISRFAPKDYPIEYRQKTEMQQEDQHPFPCTVRSPKEAEAIDWPLPRTPWWCVWRRMVR
jgi:hypothetical protein